MGLRGGKKCFINLRLLFFLITIQLLMVQGQFPGISWFFVAPNPESSTNEKNKTDVPSYYADGPTLQEKLQSPSWTSSTSNWTSAISNIFFQEEKEASCKYAEEDAKILTDSIERAVNFYETHVNQLHVVDSIIGLQVVEGVLQHIFKRRGQNINIELINRIPSLVSQIVQQALDVELLPLRKKQILLVGKDTEIWKRSFEAWKPPSVVRNRLVEFHTVGYEKEKIWGSLNTHCQSALISDCQVPYICERTFLDPEPQSQHMLTHQALYLHFAKQKSCDLKHPNLFKDLESSLDRQCAKIYQEAELIADNNFPEWARNLFAEQIGICGLAGYPNFLRRNWVQQILSWQSSTHSGCFLKATENDALITDDEVLQISNPKEKCLLQLTSTSLTPLAIQLAYFFDRCLPAEEIESDLGNL